ncbi:hypothetical protein AGABI2DRAFT_176878 [Agaricus bisporus var. bisporus H97]|uniref:hypothetical protein n=1 Tax=Agaricus bisporus var. bisporus (strain H97 / ATCC MYA-4626 / FGSC 10389) TaxID=936046 RepID=UPI00029F77EC|nr:hypothetical protein AGABI2DRAFT_176878 [Agaricus bisporus var. bisporus H97]EKV50564.1 hypothetical protein AGABI2DRAFT_176878 [Agaricus bisporus var. bisporus H97]
MVAKWHMSGIEHKAKRDYIDGVVYALPHDTEESSRLLMQHNLFLRAFDNKVLHAPVELKDDDWVLEGATGTGIWLQDLAKETSTKPHYIGIDIESNFFPQASTLPSNITFEIQSVLDLPKDWTNKFTLVHQRLLIAGLRTQDWEQDIKELYRVVKPGGWVQLFELKIWTSGPALAKHWDLLCKFSHDVGIMYRDLTTKLPEFLKQSGFVDIHEDTRGTPLGTWANQDGIDAKDNLLGVLRGLKTPILKGGGYGVVESEVEYDELLKEIEKEMDATPGSTALWTMFWARKPVNE